LDFGLSSTPFEVWLIVSLSPLSARFWILARRWPFLKFGSLSALARCQPLLDFDLSSAYFEVWLIISPSLLLAPFGFWLVVDPF
jgi:hypothetical protein